MSGAAAEGWQCIDWRLARPRALLRETIAVDAAGREFHEGAWPASAFVARQVAALIDRAERVGGRLDRKQIDGLSAFARMMERWETLARERAQQEEVARDEDVAQSLRLIDERILELALVEARRMVAAGIVSKDA